MTSTALRMVAGTQPVPNKSSLLSWDRQLIGYDEFVQFTISLIWPVKRTAQGSMRVAKELCVWYR